MRLSKMWAAAAVGALVCVGCGGAPSDDEVEDAAPVAVDKAGGSGGTLVLRMGTEGRPGRTDADQVLYFAAAVAERSGGSLQVEPVWNAAGDERDADEADYPGWDQVVAQAVVAGELDLAHVPARAWDTEGVTSLRPLTAPLLLVSNEHVAGVVTGDLADDLLAGLDDVGVVGLGLAPEEMRRLFTFGDPPVSSTPWEGGIIRAPRSTTTYALLQALGGEPSDLSGGGTDRFADGVRDGTVLAAESSFGLAGTLPQPVKALGGPPLFPKINTLVANGEAFASLPPQSQQVLREAAADTVAWAAEVVPDEAGTARSFCDRSEILPGIPDETLTSAADEVLDDLRADALTAALVDEVIDLTERVEGTPSVIAPCAPVAEEASEEVLETDPSGGFPEGVYRVEHTTEELVAAGIDRPTAASHAGVWTWRFEGGRWYGDDVNEHTGERLEGAGIYCVEQGRLRLGGSEFENPPTCGNFWSAAWELDGDELWFSDPDSAIGDDPLLEALFADKPWRRIG